MLHLISWFLVVALVATWTGCVWVLHALASWSIAGADTLIAESQKIDTFTLPEWIAPWVPPDLMLALKTSLAPVLPWLKAALSALPSPLGWLSPLTWIVWGLGSLILVVVAVLTHTLISVTRTAASR